MRRAFNLSSAILLTALALACGTRDAPERRQPKAVAATPTPAADTIRSVPETLPASWFSPRSNDSAQLLFVGTYDPGRVLAVSGQTWFGFFKANAGWELASTRVTVDSTYTPCSASTPGARGYPRVTTDRPDVPLFLVRGLPRLRSGPVRTLLSHQERVYPGQMVGPFIDGPELWELKAYGTAAPSQARPDQAAGATIRDYQLMLWTRRGNREQPIFQQPGLYLPPTVLWIGDLDGDGQADVLLDPATGGEEPVPLVLWASSLAASSELVHKVAGYRAIYCD